jgi:hypothetical protein
LEVVATEPAGDIDDLPDEVEAGVMFGFHGAGVEIPGVDAASGDLGLGVAFGALGLESPVVELLLEAIESGVGPV